MLEGPSIFWQLKFEKYKILYAKKLMPQSRSAGAGVELEYFAWVA